MTSQAEVFQRQLSDTFGALSAQWGAQAGGATTQAGSSLRGSLDAVGESLGNFLGGVTNSVGRTRDLTAGVVRDTYVDMKRKRVRVTM